MAECSGKPRYGSMKTRRSRIESLIREAETSIAPVLLKENDDSEAFLAGRKPAELGKANLLFWQRDRESTRLHRMIHIVLTKLNANLECFSVFRCLADKQL